MKSETLQHPTPAFLCRTHRWKARAQFCLPLRASHPQGAGTGNPQELGEETLRSWDSKSPFAHSLPLQHISTASPRLQIQLRFAEVTTFSCWRERKQALAPTHTSQSQEQRVKFLQSSFWVRGRHGTPVPRSPGSGQHKQRLCSAACLLCSRRSCGQRGAVRTIQGLLLHFSAYQQALRLSPA